MIFYQTKTATVNLGKQKSFQITELVDMYPQSQIGNGVASVVGQNQLDSETLLETIESGPLCITDSFQNKSVAYF